MFLGVNFLSLSTFLSPTFIPIRSAFDTVKIFGQGIFDKLWIRNIVNPESFFTSLTLENYTPIWDNDTAFLANFNNNLSAGNISIAGEEPIGWIINKRDITSAINQRVAKVAGDVLEYKDYLTQRDKTYTYQVLPYTENTIGQPLESANITSDYYGWYLIDEEDNISIKFDINVSSGGISAETAQVEYKTFNQFNTYSQGTRNFLKGQISGIVPENIIIDEEWRQSSEFIKTLQDFINNGKRKLLKSRKGDLWYVMTDGFTRSQLSDNIQEQVEVVSFNFIEVDTVTGY